MKIKLMVLSFICLLLSGCFISVCPNFFGTQNIVITDNDEPLIEGNTATADVSPLP